MILLNCLRARLVKVIIPIIVALVIVEYMFSGALFEPNRIEPLFLINTTAAAYATRQQHNVKYKITNMEGNVTTTVSNNNNMSVDNASTYVSDNSSSQQALVNDSNVYNNYSNSNSSVSSNSVEISKKRNDTQLCPPIPPNLEGPVNVDKDARPVEEIEKIYSYLEVGGVYKTQECKTRYKVALIVPYRDRAAQLAIFLMNIHKFLKKQQIDYGVFIVEQAGSGPFNRGMLMNIGFKEASKLEQYDCYIFHDVDLLPEDDRNLYTCPEQPRHMSVAVNVFRYRLPYNDLFGGVNAMTRTQFITVNGFSNLFWGWGGEDDDMFYRIRKSGYHVSRYPPTVARYVMLPHKKQKPNPKRYDILYSGKKRYKTDGLNSLKYERKELQMRKLYTWVLAELSTLR